MNPAPTEREREMSVIADKQGGDIDEAKAVAI
jgi:hypothetical protein